MTHAELQAIATDHGLKVIIFSYLEPALTGYILDKALDGSYTIRAVYDPDKTLDCLIQQGMTEEEAQDWFYTKPATDQFADSRKYPTFIYTHQ